MERALDDTRLVTLTGVGGTGKTRLAIDVAVDLADQYPDGVGFVDLATLRDPELLGIAVATACGFNPSSTAEAESLLCAAVADRTLLIVVDNVEHVVEGATLLGRLLTAAPHLRVLATSRVPLRLYGEQIVHVPPLALTGRAGGQPGDSDAVHLFMARARAAHHGFTADREDMSAVLEICRAVDGLPLAIELAAAKTHLYRPRELLARLQRRLDLLRGGPRDVPDRQQTLRGTLDWSFALLSAPAQRMFTCVSIFAGAFAISAAVAVSDETDEDLVADLLAELRDHSMLESSASPEPRFRLLQTVREYGLARLSASGEGDLVEERNLRHHLTLSRGVALPAGNERPDALLALEAASANVRIALDYAIRRGRSDPEVLIAGLHLADAVTPMWLYRGPINEGLVFLQRLLAAADRLDSKARATAELQLCSLACFAGEFDLAQTYGRQCIEPFRRYGDDAGLARTYRYCGEAAYAVGNLDEGAALFERSLEIAVRIQDCGLRGHAANALGQLQRHQGRFELARGSLRDAVASFMCVGLASGVSQALHSLAEVARDQGRGDEAESLLHAALRTADGAGVTRSIAYVLEGLAGLASLRGQSSDAVRLVAAASGIRERLGQLWPRSSRGRLTSSWPQR